jgi:hypothetical protein
MKKLLFFLLAFTAINAYGQNEFAATSFYNTFKKIREDGEKGFATYKGARLKSQFEDLNDEFKAKLLLPLADSGKVVVPVSGNPYAVYFFEPEKKKDKIDERAANLRDAVVTAYGKQLFSRTISTTVKKIIYSDTYLYSDPNEARTQFALFRINVFPGDNKYYLVLEIRGKNP